MKKELIKFWKFLRSDSYKSLFASVAIAIILIISVFFPLLKATTGTALPLVIVESCSMYHEETGFEETLSNNAHPLKGLDLEETKDWIFQKGLTKGDIIFVIRPKNLKVGDVIIFDGNLGNPIIHRVVDDTEPYATFGDNNRGQLRPGNNPGRVEEAIINENQLFGKAVFKIPYLGWIKLVLFDFRSNEPGACYSKI